MCCMFKISVYKQLRLTIHNHFEYILTRGEGIKKCKAVIFLVLFVLLTFYCRHYDLIIPHYSLHSYVLFFKAAVFRISFPSNR